MERVRVIQHNGAEIIYVDLSNYGANTITELKQTVDSAKRLVAQKPQKSVLILTHVTNTGFNNEISSIIKEYASHNTPYVKASSLVGVSGLQKIILTAVKALTGRDYFLAESDEQAKDWLAAQ